MGADKHSDTIHHAPCACGGRGFMASHGHVSRSLSRRENRVCPPRQQGQTDISSLRWQGGRGRQRAKGHQGTERSLSPSLAPKPTHPPSCPMQKPKPAPKSFSPSVRCVGGTRGPIAWPRGWRRWGSCEGCLGGLQGVGPRGQEGHCPIVLLCLGIGIRRVSGQC